MASDFILRMIEDGDIPMVTAWAESHGRNLNAPLLPKLGVLAIDAAGPCAAVWLRMDNSVGVAILEAPVTRPGTKAAAVRKVFAALLGFLETEAKSMDYGFLMTFAEPGVARVMKGFGYSVLPAKLQMITKQI